ncbi:NAD-dependent epimerase/dehydratase family protein [Sinosporangium siamense]|uniref:Reductase n=1 Tax=Sinosporangium siamense TaxID=1367973 RepID=A0A919RPJ6_9ACTN|nr:NAD-dependent epimerase/dehydratase family protein [Sinosporangium siamense]GII97570.1 reductase [Sinosporangium siamense]
MKTLIIGGSVFLGRAIVTEALRRGHEVTTFNRGRTGVDQPGVEAVRGDRGERADLERLVDGRQWDTVIDVCGYVPKVVAESAQVLNGHAAHYTYISTLSVYADWPAQQTDENGRLHECDADAGPEAGDYGVLKAGTERAVEKYFDGPRLILRPGLILGPHEDVGRQPWWLTRIARGGQVLAPGSPDSPMQMIDARDLAVFTVAQAEKQADDRFITTGPTGVPTFGEWLNLMRSATGSDAELVWVDDEFLLAQGAVPYTELPMWMPPAADFAWLYSIDSAKALAAGLPSRPVAETVNDTWEWLRHIPEAERRFGPADMPIRHGMDAEKEAAILAAWAAR